MSTSVEFSKTECKTLSTVNVLEVSTTFFNTLRAMSSVPELKGFVDFNKVADDLENNRKVKKFLKQFQKKIDRSPNRILANQILEVIMLLLQSLMNNLKFFTTSHIQTTTATIEVIDETDPTSQE